ncbi:MAG: hypothetical protein QOI22_524 [Verrucomicrobiota bacterium]
MYLMRSISLSSQTSRVQVHLFGARYYETIFPFTRVLSAHQRSSK